MRFSLEERDGFCYHPSSNLEVDEEVADIITALYGFVYDEEQHIFWETQDLYNKQNDVILVELVDKLHNLISDYDLFKKYGKDALSSSNATYKDNRWYYLEMQKLFNIKLKNNKLLDRYNGIIDIYFY